MYIQKLCGMMAGLTILFVLLLLWPSARSLIHDPDRKSSRELDIKLSLNMHKRQQDTIFKYQDVSHGKHNHTLELVSGRVATGADKHKTQPPGLGSICKHGDYEQIFAPYYAVDFTNYELRLHEHNIIEQRLAKEDDAFAWGLCQYAAIKMQCSERRRCECLSQKPPFRYVRQGSNCVGTRGAECTHNRKAPVYCDKSLNCTDGYCGGIDVAYQEMIARASSSTKSILLFSLGFGVLIYS